MAGRNQYKAQQFIDAIPGSGGVKTTIARRVGCDWHTADKYIREYATVAQAYEAECEKVLDKAEHNIIAPIMQDDDADVALSKWYLKMKGGKRGYVPTQKQWHSGPEGKPLPVVYLPTVADEADEPDAEAEE